jgi:CRP/FNR family cyclic AMP-dependent transcriptional regulator
VRIEAGYNPFVDASAEEGLQGVRFFEFLTEEEREEFLEGSELVTFEVGEAFIEEGGETHDLFVLTSGRVEVRKSISGGRDRLLAEIDAASGRTVVGERALLGESGVSATVRAASRVEAIKIPHRTFRRMVSEGRPAAFKLSYRIARTLARRLTRLDEEVVETIRELEDKGETDLEAFRDKLITDWAV